MPFSVLVVAGNQWHFRRELNKLSVVVINSLRRSVKSDDTERTTTNRPKNPRVGGSIPSLATGMFLTPARPKSFLRSHISGGRSSALRRRIPE